MYRGTIYSLALWMMVVVRATYWCALVGARLVGACFKLLWRVCGVTWTAIRAWYGRLTRLQVATQLIVAMSAGVSFARSIYLDKQQTVTSAFLLAEAARTLDSQVIQIPKGLNGLFGCSTRGASPIPIGELNTALEGNVDLQAELERYLERHDQRAKWGLQSAENFALANRRFHKQILSAWAQFGPYVGARRMACNCKYLEHFSHFSILSEKFGPLLK